MMILFFFILFQILGSKRRLLIFSTSFNYVSIIASNYMEIMKICPSMYVITIVIMKKWQQGKGSFFLSLSSR